MIRSNARPRSSELVGDVCAGGIAWQRANESDDARRELVEPIAKQVGFGKHAAEMCSTTAREIRSDFGWLLRIRPQMLRRDGRMGRADPHILRFSNPQIPPS